MEIKDKTAWTYWSVPLEELFAKLQSSTEGLATPEATTRLTRFGPNLLKAKKHTTTPGLFINQFKSAIMLILLFATIASAFLRDWVDAVIILLIILGSAFLSFMQEYRANDAAEKLRHQLTINADVLRDGNFRSIAAENIVPGDIIQLSAGSLIPADGIVFEAKDFFVNQAVLTGETFPVEKKAGNQPAHASLAERANVVYMGTNVRSGNAHVLIVNTGAQTAFGQIAKRLTLRPPENAFERGVKRLGYLLSEVMFVLVLVIFAFNVFFHKPILDSLLFSIALAVGLTPQLLPAIININLSKGSQVMASRGVIVRRLEAIENFGSMDILCTDKTGTLTQGVVNLDAALDAFGETSKEVFRYAYLNAMFQTGLSNPLDDAIRKSKELDIANITKLDEIPYDFVRKRLSVVIRENNQCKLISKGAFENVLEVCTQILTGSDQQIPLEKTHLNELKQRFMNWSQQGYRVLGLGYKTVPQQTVAYERGEENNLTFAGFLLFLDPPKLKVEETIKELSQLGVQLKIITGDNQLVAQHIAQAVGLDHRELLTGAQLDNLHEEALWNAAERTTIFAEVDPNQKERIILALKKTGHVVGYMGDGINDAPSLHSADVGISVDNAVDVAKEAADFVLLKQDLEVLQQGILEGRKTFANTLKYIFMATSANFGNMFSVAGASLFLPYLPMLPKQILLINFLTDLPEMTIAGDNVDPTLLTKPHRWNVSFIRRFMLVFGTLSSIFDFMTFGLLLLLLHARQDLFHTGWFIESVLSASLVVFTLRTRLPFIRSQPSRAMMAITGLVGLIALTLPYSPLAGILGFQPLPGYYLIGITSIVFVYFASAEIVKRWFYKNYDL
jgi:Mg2+-importing ATPase